MRTSSERRHFDEVATARQANLASAICDMDAREKSMVRYQAGRLRKVNASTILNGRQSSNPRNQEAKAKDKLTHAELGMQAAWDGIELQEIVQSCHPEEQATEVAAAQALSAGVQLQ